MNENERAPELKWSPLGGGGVTIRGLGSWDDGDVLPYLLGEYPYLRIFDRFSYPFYGFKGERPGPVELPRNKASFHFTGELMEDEVTTKNFQN